MAASRPASVRESQVSGRGGPVAFPSFFADLRGSSGGGIRRVAREGEFRANVHRGGLGKKLEITDELADLTRRSAGAFSLPLCGVDILESADGFKVLEVNASPGFEGLEKTTGEDVAEKIIEFLGVYRERNTIG